MANMTPWVRQYALRDLLDATFDLFKERATLLLLAGLIPYACVLLYVAVMRLFVVPGHFEPESSTPIAYWQALYNNPELLWYNIGLAIISLLAVTVGYIAQCRIAAWHAMHEPLSLRAAFRLLFKPFWGLVVLGVIYSVFLAVVSSIALSVGGLVVGLIALLALEAGEMGALIIGGITILVFSALALLAYAIVSAMFLAAPVIMAVEHAGPFTAIGRAFSTASGNFRAHLIAFFLLQHIPIIVAILLSVLMALIGYLLNMLAPVTVLALASLFGWASTVVALAIFSCLQALVYLDGRCRHEHYDILLLGQQIGIGAQVAAALSTPNSAAQAAHSGSLFPNYAAEPVAPGFMPAETLIPQEETLASAIIAAPDYSAPPPAAADELPQSGSEEMVDTTTQEGRDA